MLNKIRLLKSGEWKPCFRGWCIAFIENGFSYWRDQNEAREIEPGSVVVASAEARGSWRASQLSEVEIAFYCVDTEKLSGLLSLSEQHFLKQAASHKSHAARVYPPASPMAAAFGKLQAVSAAPDSAQRLRLLQLFTCAFEWQTEMETMAPSPWKDGRERFRKIMSGMAASEFVELSLSQLAPMMSCSPRHLNRLFRKELGTSFREKQIELRLARACDLLANSDAKVVEIALESGYQSSSVFSELFKRRFGVSPGQWRRQRLGSGAIRA